MKNINIIAAIGRNGELGAKNKLLWNLPSEMKHFQDTTKGATVIMGRNTLDSIGGALKGRRNIVITRKPRCNNGNIEFVSSPYEAIAICDKDEEVFIIGGASIYREFLKPEMRQFLESIILTRVDADFPEADSFFPEFNVNNFLEGTDGLECSDDIDFQVYQYIPLTNQQKPVESYYFKRNI